jgi:hypothetical protein
MSTLNEILDQHVGEAAYKLYEKLDRNRVRCYSCGHCCPIAAGQAGVCKVRFNRGGTLYAPWGYVGGVQCDPIEKKPFFHAYCGALVRGSEVIQVPGNRLGASDKPPGANPGGRSQTTPAASGL